MVLFLIYKQNLEKIDNSSLSLVPMGQFLSIIYNEGPHGMEQRIERSRKKICFEKEKAENVI